MKKAIKIGLKFFVTAILLILVASCGSATVSAESGIKIKAGQSINLDDVSMGLENGWSSSEGGHTWSNGYLSILKFNYDNEFENGMNLTIRMGSFVNNKNPNMKVSIKANDVVVKELDFNESLSGGDISIDISSEVLKKNSSQLILSFDMPNAAVPSEIGWNRDGRRLGIWISKIQVNKI